MKAGRNDPCPCGSAKKYKHCCIDKADKVSNQLHDELSHILVMNPDLSLDELNLIAQHKMGQLNNRPNPDFCGLTPTQMANWLYAPFNELDWVKITVPETLSASPVMRYLQLMLEQAMQQDGVIKLTPKGNLPTKLVKQACALLPEFAVAEYETVPSISEYQGSNEDKFNALHYVHILAELSGIFYVQSGHLHLKKAAQKEYQAQGLQAFFLPMLAAAVKEYNWAYMDLWTDEVDVGFFWLFMLWRVQTHGSVEQLIEEVKIAFPDLMMQIRDEDFMTSSQILAAILETRFIKRFLEFWGFVVTNRMHFENGQRVPTKLEILPLLQQSFAFQLKP